MKRFEPTRGGAGLILFASLLALGMTGSAQVTDFTIITSGPHHVVQGRYFTFYTAGQVLAGTDNTDGTVPTVSGLPPGASAEFLNMSRFCCGTHLYRVGSDNPLRITTSPTTPIGTYVLQVNYQTSAGVTRSTPYTIYVDPVPVPPTPLTVTTNPPLAAYDQWKANAAIYGVKHCTPDETSNLSETKVWYYDGARVYYQIADLTGDSSFNTCGDMVLATYSQYVNANNGGIPGWRVFGQGLTTRFLRTGDLAARQTLATLRAGGPYTDWPNTAYSIDWSVSREISYSVEVNLLDQSVGGTPNPHFQDLVEALFGHFDQWFLSKSSSIVQPFMVALASEALIAYWDKTQDTRVLPMLQMAADRLWAQSWDVPCQCFLYYNDPANPTNTSAAADLNGLVAPLYGWVFKQTGLTIYRDRGDQIFNGSLNAWFDGGKQFSQTYRWSGKYVEFRDAALASPSAPSVAITAPTAAATFTTSASPISLQGTASDDEGIVQVTWINDRGGSGNANGTTAWSIAGIALQVGVNRITVTARDGAGNVSSAALTVTYTGADTTSPTVTITSPTTALTLNVGSSTLNLGGTASDNVGVSQVTWATNKGASGTATGTTNWTVNGLVLVSGSTTVTVTARDAAGNVASKTLTVNYTPGADTIPPTVTIKTPTTALAWNAPNSTLNMGGTASDNVGVSQVTWTTDRGTSGTATGTTNWTISGMVLLSGTTIVTVTARDAAGNVANRTLTVTYTPGGDAVSPTVTITSPTSGSTFSTAYSILSLGGTASDNIGVTQVAWSTNRGTSGTATGTTNWTVNGLVLPVGDTYVTVAARDAAGNIASRTLAVSYTPPGTVSVAIDSPTSQSTYYASQKKISLGGHASANTTQVSWVADQGQGQATGTTAWTASGIDLRNGSNQITVTATDSDGNQSTALLTVIFLPPAITITSLPNAQVGKHYSYPLTAVSGTPPFTWSAANLPDGLSVSADGLIAGKPVTMGIYSVDITVQDSVQATASATVSMQVGNGISLMSAATLTAGPVAPESWAAAFGSQLADTTLSIMSSPVPIKLGESTVTVRDANGVERAAGMNYVSDTHINFTIPADTAVGPATVTVYSGNEIRGVGVLDIATVAPGIFYINQDGLANAGLLRINGDSYAYESIIKMDTGTNQYVGLPINLGSGTDQVYLTLYGTGWRFRPSLESVSVTIGGMSMPVVYAGAAGYYEDVDIVNVLLTPQLRGRGKVDIVLTVNGVTANVVRVRFQ